MTDYPHMKIRVHRRVHPDTVGAAAQDAAVQDLDAPLVFCAADGDGTLYYHLYRLTGARMGGGFFPEGEWIHVEEIATVPSQLSNVWRKAQDRLADNPHRIPHVTVG